MRFKQIIGAAGLLAACISGTPGFAQDQGGSVQSPTPAQRAELWNTEQFVIRSTILGRDMLIQVVKPLAPPERNIPGVYLVDGNLYTSFAVNPMVGAFLGEYAPAYFIGVSYPEQSPLHWVRQRATDLLHAPNVNLAGPDFPYMEGVRSGGGALFQRFLVEELRPLVEARYAIDSSRTVLAGVSFGGLFTTRVMLDAPTAFSAYLIGSPSLWVEPSLVERARTAQLQRGSRVFVSAGGSEEEAQVASARALAAALRENPSGAAVTEWIVPDEGHAGFAPAFFGRALKTVLPPAPATR
jgi:predicted alpha/beta superfamily hydrolase